MPVTTAPIAAEKLAIESVNSNFETSNRLAARYDATDSSKSLAFSKRASAPEWHASAC